MSAWWTGKSTRWRAARTVIASAVLIGLGGLVAGLNVWVGVGAAILIVLAAWPVLLPMIAVVLLRVVGAFIVAALALVGVNVAVDELPDPPILCGLFAALLVFLPVAYWYLRGAHWNEGVTRVAAVFLTLRRPQPRTR